MGLFGSSQERDLKKDLARERKVKYKGTNLQQIGQIPSGVEVVLSLDPEKEALCITYKSTVITLPYDRIQSFAVGLMETDKTNKILKGAQSFLSSTEAKPTGFDPLGAKKLFAGLAGNVASNLIPQNKIISAIATLSYTDKSGIDQQLQFSNSQETGYGISHDDAFHDIEAEEFAKVILAMKSRRSEKITEL